jgi:NTP pyrophosphatase (non-canonical NTP hydrolase)
MKSFEEYELLAARTRSKTNDSVLNASLGLAGEMGELIELIKKEWFHGKYIYPEDVLKEIGDVLFYLSWLANLKGFTLEQAATANIEKLMIRYPEGFVMGGGNGR